MTNDKPWNEKLLEVLRQTGENIRSEAQRLLSDLSDPANQERVRQGLAEMGEWAKKTADEAAKLVDEAAYRVDQAIAAARRKPAAKKAAKKVAKKPAKKAKRPAAKKKKAKR